jgi:hypothetical protein
MDGLFKDIFPALFCVVACAWWWLITKDAATRKYILSLGICWLVAGTSYTIAKSFDILGLMVIVLLAFLFAIYFLIKAALSERKAKKK